MGTVEAVAESFEGWYRVGGSRMDFYATDEEIAEWILETLPGEYAPYAIVGREWVEAEGSWRGFEYPLSRIRDAFAEKREWNLWIRSDQLSPRISSEDEKPLVYGGLILVQLGSQRHGVLEDASVAVVDRLRHEVTGAERRQPEYRRIFDRLRSSLRKRLVVTTTRTRPDGGVDPSSPMTPHAAEAHARGDVRFAADPGGLRD